MNVQFAYILLMLVTIFLMGGMVLYAWRFRYTKAAPYFGLFVAASACWALMVAAMALAPPKAGMVLLNLKYLFISITPVAVFLFVLVYTGQEKWLGWRTAAGLFAIPAVMQIVVWTNGWHHGYLRQVEFVRTGELSYPVRLAFGPLYWVFAGYGYLMILMSVTLILASMFRGGLLVRSQGAALALGVSLPLISNVFLLTGIAPPEYDPMPFGLALAGGLLWWGAFRHHVLDLAPVARNILMDVISDGVLAIDDQGRILDINRSMSEIAGVAASAAVGRPALEVLRNVPELADRFIARDAGLESSAPEKAMVRIGDRHFEVRFLDLDPQAGRRGGGRLVLLHDLTERTRMEAEREHLIGDLREALAQVKTLKGMLPICASCKKIRDDQGYWHQVDVYLRDHSEAELSHGICPECHDKIYPEYARKR